MLAGKAPKAFYGASAAKTPRGAKRKASLGGAAAVGPSEAKKSKIATPAKKTPKSAKKAAPLTALKSAKKTPAMKKTLWSEVVKRNLKSAKVLRAKKALDTARKVQMKKASPEVQSTKAQLVRFHVSFYHQAFFWRFFCKDLQLRVGENLSFSTNSSSFCKKNLEFL